MQEGEQVDIAFLLYIGRTLCVVLRIVILILKEFKTSS